VRSALGLAALYDVSPSPSAGQRRAPGVGLPAVLCGLLIPFLHSSRSLAEPQETAVRALAVDQEVSGIPGLEAKKKVRQRLLLDPTGKWAAVESLEGGGTGSVSLSSSGANRMILRMDAKQPTLLEISDRDRSYRTTPANFSHIQAERDLRELYALQNLARDPAARKKVLDENHLREDGRRVVEVTVGASVEILGFSCKEIVVTENNRLVIQAWMTKDIAGGANFYELYQSLGAFSKEVLEKIRPLEGVPLKARFKVITATPVVYELHVEALKLEKDVSIPRARLEIPEEYRQIEDAPSVLPCPVCKKEFEWENPGGRIIDPLDPSKEHRTCSRVCYQTLKKELDLKFSESQKKPRKPPAPAPSPENDVKPPPGVTEGRKD
jgi:hypothetical protein